MRSKLLLASLAALAASIMISSCGLFPDAETRMITTRDGAFLATDVYMPKGHQEGQTHPAILMRTTYNKDAKNKGIKIHSVMAKPFTDDGYVVLVQDTRGRNSSTGVDSIFFNDRNDGYDTVEWITQQAWSDGNVGMMGLSALGVTSYMATSSGHPALKAAYAVAAASNMYNDVFYPGGAYRQKMADGWVTGQGREEFLPFIYEHSSYSEKWDQVNLPAYASETRAAVYHLGGWFDAMQQGQINAFKALQTGGGQGARENQYLVMGAWGHSGPDVGELSYPENVNDINPLGNAKGFFDHYLKNEENSIAELPAVRYYLLGDPEDSTATGNEWRSADQWPPAGVVEQKFYLREGGALSTSPSDTRNQSAAYVYNPADPVPTIGGCNLYKPLGVADLRDSVESRDDVISFTSDVLTEPLVIAGNVRCRLWASSSREDTDFNVMLSDVYSDGRSMLMLDGVVRARHRNSLREEEFLVPGRVYEFDIDLWDIALAVNEGHRIRVNVTSSNAPRFLPNPNTPTPLMQDTVGVPATNTIYFDATHPSALIIPMLREEG